MKLLAGWRCPCVRVCALAYFRVHLALCFYLRIGIALAVALTAQNPSSAFSFADLLIS